MAKAENLLTVKTLQSLRIESKGKTLRDGGGLIGTVGISRNESATVTFSYRYRSGGKIREKRVGTWPASSLADIRVERNRLRALVESGIDPIAKEQRDREDAAHQAQKAEAIRLIEAEELRSQKIAAQKESAEPTMDELFALWDANHGILMEAHWRIVRQSHWRCHISPNLGHFKIKDADKGPMLQHYDKMILEGKEDTARRILALLKQVICWGIERQLVDDAHPLTRLIIPKKKRTVREDQLPENFKIQDFLKTKGEDAIGVDNEDNLSGRALPFRELVSLLHDKLPRSTQALSGKCIIRLMLATGIRTSEAVRLRWDWIDLERRLLIIPAGSMKKRRMHHVHLSNFAVTQLQMMLAVRWNDFVFAAPKKDNDHVLRGNVGNDISSRQFYREAAETEKCYQARLAKRMKCRRSRDDFNLYNLPGGKWTLYDMRRTTATRLEELGIDREMVGRVLAHAQPDDKTTGRYAQYAYWQRRCHALDILGQALAECEKGELPSVLSNNVILGSFGKAA